MKVLFTRETSEFTLVGKSEPDLMKLFIEITSKEGAKPKREAVLAELATQVPAESIDHAVVDDTLKTLIPGKKSGDRRVAKGIPAVDGADGKLLLLVKPLSKKGEVTLDERGYAHYSDLHLFDNVQKAQVVGRVYSPKPGTDGKNILGKPVSAKIGRAIKVSTDKTIVLSPSPEHPAEYQILTAQEEGYLFDDSGRFTIVTQFTVQGDLDFRYGNIDFIGAVKVTGAVTPGLHVKAKGDIEIQGPIQGGLLSSSAGSVTVKGFVYGGKSGHCIAWGNFSATIAHELQIDTGASTFIKKEAIDCVIRTQGSVFCEGQIVGGEVFAVCGVESKYIGNDAGKRTVIHLSNDVEMSTEYARLQLDIESHEKAAHLIKLHLGPLASNPDRVNLLQSPLKERMQKMLAKVKEVEQSKIRLLAQKQKMLSKAHANPVQRINFKDTLYHGAEIYAGKECYIVNEDIKGPKSLDYLTDRKVFELGDLKGLECPINSRITELAQTKPKK